MQCLGRVKGRRCKVKNVRFFCRHHKSQALAVSLALLSPVALVAGFYQDALKPVWFGIFRTSPAESRAKVKDKLFEEAKAKNWGQVALYLRDLEIQGLYPDLVHYFRGWEAQKNQGNLDRPERHFAQVPPESDLYLLSLRKRFYLAGRQPTDEDKIKAIGALKEEVTSGPKALSPYSLILQTVTCGGGLGCCRDCSVDEFLKILEPFERAYQPIIGQGRVEFCVELGGSTLVELETLGAPIALYVAESFLAQVATQEANFPVAQMALANAEKLETDFGADYIRFWLKGHFGMEPLFDATLDLRANASRWRDNTVSCLLGISGEPYDVPRGIPGLPTTVLESLRISANP